MQAWGERYLGRPRNLWLKTTAHRIA